MTKLLEEKKNLKFHTEADQPKSKIVAYTLQKSVVKHQINKQIIKKC